MDLLNVMMPVRKAKVLPQYFASLAASFGAFAIGFGLGWSAPAQIPLTEGDEYFPISEDQYSWISSIILLGNSLSCLPIGYSMNKLGRKWAMITVAIPFTIGWILVIWAQNFSMLFAGRFLIGLGGGPFCITAPQYTAEISQKEIRGTLSCFMELLQVTGILFAFIVGAGTSVFWLSIIGGILPFIFISIFYFMPESPTYLMSKGKDDKAIKVFKRLRGEDYDPSEEVEELKADLLEEKKNNLSFMETLKLPASMKALFIGFFLMFFQQMSGINVVVFYATKIFEVAGAEVSPALCTIILGSLQVIAAFASVFVIERLGRKILLLISIIVVIICLILLGIFFYMLDRDPASVSKVGWLPLASLSIYILAFEIGLGPVAWVMLGEIYSNELKLYASPISGAFNWFLAFLITYFFQSLSDAIGIGETFWLFAVVSFIGVVFIIWIVPETKNKSLSEIQRMLA